MLLDALLNLGSTIADKLFPDADRRLDMKHQKERFQQLYKLALLEESMRETSEFRKFMLQYEGKLIDIPRPIQFLRSSVRPVITYVATGSYVYAFLHPERFTPDQLSMFHSILLLVLGFWFGERLLSRTGIVELLKAKIKKE